MHSRDERKLHYSLVEDLPLKINLVTGRSQFYGVTPWRCADRFADLMTALLSLQPLSQQLQLYRLLRCCAKSEVGHEPTDDYTHLSHDAVLVYVDRYRAGMLRPKLFESYRYNELAVRAVCEADAQRMRVWRMQRRYELEAKSAALDDLVHSNVMSKWRSSP